MGKNLAFLNVHQLKEFRKLSSLGLQWQHQACVSNVDLDDLIVLRKTNVIRAVFLRQKWKQKIQS